MGTATSSCFPVVLAFVGSVSHIDGCPGPVTVSIMSTSAVAGSELESGAEGEIVGAEGVSIGVLSSVSATTSALLLRLDPEKIEKREAMMEGGIIGRSWSGDVVEGW